MKTATTKTEKKKKKKKKKKKNDVEQEEEEFERINPLRRRGRERARSRPYDDDIDDAQRGRQTSTSSSSSSSDDDDDTSDDDDDDTDKNKAADDILLENSRRMRFNDIRRKRELFTQVERERDTLIRIQREKEMRAYLDQEMVEMKKKLTIESALNEEEDEERIRNAEMAAETLCKYLDDAECFTRQDIDWDDHERKWTEFDTASTYRGGGKAGEEQKTITISNVPWPPSEDILQHMAAFEMRQKQEEGEELEPGKGAQRKVAAAEKIYKKAFRRANLRWHPDKFTAKYGKYLDESDRVAILARVEEISMTVNSSYEQLMF